MVEQLLLTRRDTYRTRRQAVQHKIYSSPLSGSYIYIMVNMSMPVDERHRIGLDTFFFPRLKSRRHQ